MKTKFYLFILALSGTWCLIIPKIAVAQSYWQKNYPVEITQGIGHDVQETPDGGFIFAGEIDYDLGAIIHKARLVKVDADGNMQWEKTYQTPDQGSYSGALSVRVTPDGGYAFAGFSYGQVFFVRTDANGDTLFTRTFATDLLERCYVVRLFPNGDYLLGCGTQGFEGELPFLMRLNPNGDLLWRKDILTLSFATTAIKDIEIINDDEFVYLFNENFPRLTGADGSGETLWTTNYAISKYDQINGFVISGDGEFTLAGFATGIIGFNPAISKANNSGNVYWTNFLNPLTYQATSVERIPDGFIAGISASWSSGDTTKVYFSKINAAGGEVWNTAYPGDANSFVAYPTTDGGFIGAGTLNGTMMLVKTDGSGEITTGNHDPDAFPTLDIFPNPASDFVELKFGSGLSEVTRLEWLSLDGQLLGRTSLEQGSTNYQLSTAAFPSGVYLLRLVQGEAVAVKRVVVQR